MSKIVSVILILITAFSSELLYAQKVVTVNYEGLNKLGVKPGLNTNEKESKKVTVKELLKIATNGKISYQDLQNYFDKKEGKEPLPERTVCVGNQVCFLDCENTTLIVYDIPLSCHCDSHPDCCLTISCTGCPSYYISCSVE